jgi:hypothetical protein
MTNASSSNTNTTVNGTATHNTGAVLSGVSSGHDALYVGDLQWVRCLIVPLQLRLYSEIVVFCVHVCSGPRTKICVRWHITLALQLSSRTLHSLSTRSTGRAKGKFINIANESTQDAEVPSE